MRKIRVIYLNDNFLPRQYNHFRAGQKAHYSIGSSPFDPLKEIELPRVFLAVLPFFAFCLLIKIAINQYIAKS